MELVVKTPSEAIAHLKARGLDAHEGWGAMAETIWVGARRRVERLTSGKSIHVYDAVAWIVPQGTGWSVLQPFDPWASEEALSSLEEACEIAERVLTRARPPG